MEKGAGDGMRKGESEDRDYVPETEESLSGPRPFSLCEDPRRNTRPSLKLGQQERWRTGITTCVLLSLVKHD